MSKRWLVVCLFNFLVAAVMGLLLRLTLVWPLPVEFTNLLHAHSHTAMLGWACMMIFGLLVGQLAEPLQSKYKLLFWITQTAVVGMMIAFPLQGYGAFSISFSTLHILCSYVFAYRLHKDLGGTKNNGLIKLALVFMLVSTLGAWSLGAIGATLGKTSPYYKSGIQFFLHFQFNGWFLIAAIGLLINELNAGLGLNRTRIIGWLLGVSAVLTFGHSLGGYFPNTVFHVANSAGVLVQMITVGLLFYWIAPIMRAQKIPLSLKMLLALSLASLFLKAALQVMTVLPEIALAAHKVRNLTIGFIHLAMLGAVTGILLFLAARRKPSLLQNAFWLPSVVLLCVGFAVTETLLFAQGIRSFLKLEPMADFQLWMFAATVLLPLAIALAFTSAVRSKHI